MIFLKGGFLELKGERGILGENGVQEDQLDAKWKSQGGNYRFRKAHGQGEVLGVRGDLVPSKQQKSTFCGSFLATKL